MFKSVTRNKEIWPKAVDRKRQNFSPDHLCEDSCTCRVLTPRRNPGGSGARAGAGQEEVGVTALPPSWPVFGVLCPNTAMAMVSNEKQETHDRSETGTRRNGKLQA